jgi:hypothetical protein
VDAIIGLAVIAISSGALVQARRHRAPRVLAGLARGRHRSAGRITGVHRTWLDRARPDKALLANPRRALGHLLGNGVRFPAFFVIGILGPMKFFLSILC